MTKQRKPDLQLTRNGRVCQVWRRRTHVQVVVLDGQDVIGDWEMPVAMRYDLRMAADVAEVQTGVAVRYQREGDSVTGGEPGEVWLATYVVPLRAASPGMTEAEAEGYDSEPTFRKVEK